MLVVSYTKTLKMEKKYFVVAGEDEFAYIGLSDLSSRTGLI